MNIREKLSFPDAKKEKTEDWSTKIAEIVMKSSTIVQITEVTARTVIQVVLVKVEP